MGDINARCKSIAKRSISNLAVRICRAMQQFPRDLPPTTQPISPVTNWANVMNVLAPEGTLSFEHMVEAATSIHRMMRHDVFTPLAQNTYINLGYTFDQTIEHLRYDLPVHTDPYTGDFYDLCRALALTDVDARIVRIRTGLDPSHSTYDVFDQMADTLFSIHKLIRDIPRIEGV